MKPNQTKNYIHRSGHPQELCRATAVGAPQLSAAGEGGGGRGRGQAGEPGEIFNVFSKLFKGNSHDYIYFADAHDSPPPLLPAPPPPPTLRRAQELGGVRRGHGGEPRPLNNLIYFLNSSPFFINFLACRDFFSRGSFFASVTSAGRTGRAARPARGSSRRLWRTGRRRPKGGSPADRKSLFKFGVILP